MTGSIAPIIGREGNAHNAESANDVGGYGVEVCLDGVVAETGDDLGEEVGGGEEGDAGAEADYHVEGPDAVFLKTWIAEREENAESTSESDQFNVAQARFIEHLPTDELAAMRW